MLHQRGPLGRTVIQLPSIYMFNYHYYFKIDNVPYMVCCPPGLFTIDCYTAKGEKSHVMASMSNKIK